MGPVYGLTDIARPVDAINEGKVRWSLIGFSP